MTSQTGQAEFDRETRKRGLDRVVTLSDAVVAIAATLLILPLVDAAGEIHGGRVSTLLNDNRDTLLAFTLSFVVIVRFWLDHHGLYARVVDYTTPLLWVNFVWVFSIVFLPFPTELIGAGSAQDRVGLGLYVGTLLAAAAAAFGQRWLIARSPTLSDAGPDAAPEATDLTASAVGVVVLALALVLAVAVPRVGLFWLLLLTVTGLINRAVVRVRALR